MHYTYYPKGVCSRQFDFEIEDNIIKDLVVTGGCNGNLKGISSLIKNMNVKDVIEKIKGTTCGFKDTSCPDQIALALENYLKDYPN